MFSGVPLIILDTDIGSSTDDLFSLEMQVYMVCNCNTGQKMWDPLTVINAVEGDGLFTLTERGTVALHDDGTAIFTPSATGNCRVQIPGDDAWCSSMLEKIRNVNKIH